MIDAEYYCTEWDTAYDGDKDELNAILRRAEAVVDGAIFLSGITVKAAPECLRERLNMAVCAQAEYIIENGGISALSESNSGGSVSLGKFSYSGGSEGGAGGSACALCPQAVSMLECTGLLYKGVDML